MCVTVLTIFQKPLIKICFKITLESYFSENDRRNSVLFIKLMRSLSILVFYYYAFYITH